MRLGDIESFCYLVDLIGPRADEPDLGIQIHRLPVLDPLDHRGQGAVDELETPGPQCL